MERLLCIWIEDCIQKRISLSTTAIKTKIMHLSNAVKENRTESGI